MQQRPRIVKIKPQGGILLDRPQQGLIALFKTLLQNPGQIAHRLPMLPNHLKMQSLAQIVSFQASAREQPKRNQIAIASIGGKASSVQQSLRQTN
jgi:hypothetical protein